MGQALHLALAMALPLLVKQVPSPWASMSALCCSQPLLMLLQVLDLQAIGQVSIAAFLHQFICIILKLLYHYTMVITHEPLCCIMPP